jgi:hypothetical protein
MSDRLRDPPRIAAILSVAWLVVATVQQSDTGVSFLPSLLTAAAALSLIVWWVARVVLAVFAGREHIRWGAPWAVVPGALALGALASISLLPLSLRVRLSADSLVRAAPSLAALSASDLRESGARVGLFRVREFQSIDSELRFITSECGLLDTCGLVFSPNGVPVHRGEDSFTHLYGPWWHLYQSW